MNKFSLKFSTLIAATVIFTACGNDETVIPDDNGTVNILTRVGTTESSGTATPSNDTYTPDNGTQLFLYYNAIGSSQNTTFTYDGTGWTSTDKLYWNDLTSDADGTYPFFAVAPQVPADSPSVAADQNKSQGAAYDTSDLLIAHTVATSRRVTLNLNLQHVLAQLKVNVESPAGSAMVDLSDATLTVNGARLAYTLKNNGTVETGTDDSSIAALTPKNLLRTAGGTDKSATASFVAILPPQQCTLKFTFNIGGKSYTYEGKDAELTSGKSTAYKLNISKSSITLNSVTLAPWENGAQENGNVQGDGIHFSSTVLNGIDEAGTFYLAANTTTGNVAGHGIYPVKYENSAADIDTDNAAYSPIYWDNLADDTYHYALLFVPDAYRNQATAALNHEKDYLTATSAATAWGTQPDFSQEDTPTGSGNGTRLKHAMAQLTTMLASSDQSFTDDELKNASIEVYSARNVAPDAGSGKLNITDLDNGSTKTVQLLPATGSATKSALIAPQTLKKVVISINGHPYTLTRDLPLEANQIYTLKVDVKRSPLGLTIAVTSWESKDQTEDEVVIDK